MKLIVNNEIRIKDPDTRVMQWCRNVLTMKNPEYIKKLKMGFGVWNTPATLEMYRKDGDDIVVPYGTYHCFDNFEKIDETCTHLTPVDYNAKDMHLYDYQQRAVDAMCQKRCGILNAPTGSGKTSMGIAMVFKLGYKALWLTHTKDLLNQALERAEQFADKELMGTITAGKIRIGKGITFATVQTMARLDLQKYRNVWDVVITDECQRISGSELKRTQFHDVLTNLNARYKYGLTATVHRADGLEKTMFSLIGNVVYKVEDVAVADKIMTVGVQEIFTHCDFPEGCTDTDGTLIYAQFLTALAGNYDRNRRIAKLIERETLLGNSCLVLTDRLMQTDMLFEMLPEKVQGLCVRIDGGTPKMERERNINLMRWGDKRVMFASYKLAKEGLDIPRLNRLFMATPQKDEAIIIQSVGRIARICEGKEDAVCFDFVDDFRMSENWWRERCKQYRKCRTVFL